MNKNRKNFKQTAKQNKRLRNKVFIEKNDKNSLRNEELKIDPFIKTI